MAEAEQYARTLSKRHPIPPDLARGRQDGSSRLLEKHFRTRMRCRDLDFVDVFGDWARLEGQKRQFQFRRSGMGQVFQQPARTGKITLLRTAERPAQQVSSTSPEAMPPAWEVLGKATCRPSMRCHRMETGLPGPLQPPARLQSGWPRAPESRRRGKTRMARSPRRPAASRRSTRRTAPRESSGTTA